VRRGADVPSLVAGLVTIALGIVLLLDQTGEIDLRFAAYFPLGLAAVGAVLLAGGLARGR
jgi:hypothetical protein